MSNGINRPYGLEVVQSQIGNGGTQNVDCNQLLTHF
jgi:hypothetical protein